MLRLSEAVHHKKCNRFLKIIHIYANHCVLYITMYNINMMPVRVLHADIRRICSADILFRVAALKTESLKEGNSRLSIFLSQSLD